MERACQSPVIDVIQNVCKAWDAQCSITRWNTKKRVENTTHSGVLRGVSSGDETLCWILDIMSQTKGF